MRRLQKRKKTGLCKKPMNKAVLAAVLTLVICAAFTVMLGNYLSGKAELSAKNTTAARDTGEALSTDAVKKSPSPDIQAFYADLKPENAVGSAADKLSESGARAVGAVLFNNGAPLYTSSVCALFNIPRSGTETASDICGAFKEKGLYVSALFYSRALALEDSEKTASDAFEALILEEIAASGADEAVLFFGPLSISDEDGALSYFDTAKAANPNFKIGIAIPFKTISDERGASLVYSLYLKYDFICFDFRGALPEGELEGAFGADISAAVTAGEDETGAAVQEGVLFDAKEAVCAAVKNALYYITKYNARIILPELEDKEAFYPLLKTESLTNYQFIPK